MDLIAELSAVIRMLDENGIPYALCGGLAVALHGYVLTTQDIDLLIPPEQWDAAQRTVAEIGYTLDGGTIPVGFGEPFPCEIRRISKAVGKALVTLDFILVNPSLESAWVSRQKYHWQGQDLWVVSRDGLGIMKRLSRRPIDLVDLQQLGIGNDES